MRVDGDRVCFSDCELSGVIDRSDIKIIILFGRQLIQFRIMKLCNRAIQRARHIVRQAIVVSTRQYRHAIINTN